VPITLWTSARLLRTLTDDRLNGEPSYFLDTYFREKFFSGQKEILIEDLPVAYRTLAPFVLPTEQGKPIYKEKQSNVRSFTPAYVKVKDIVTPVDASGTSVRVLLGEGDLSLQQKFDLAVDKRINEHLRAIRTRNAWMAARALIDGQVTVRYGHDQGFPQEYVIGYGRDAGHTVVKGSNFWDNPATLILDDIEAWGNTMLNAVRGGFPARLYVGSAVAGVFRKNAQIRAEMDLTVRGNAVNIQTGIQRIDRGLNYIGTLSGGVEVYSYKDDVEAPNGTITPILDPKDVLLVAPGVEGIQAFGAIYNHRAMGGAGVSGEIFPSMWDQNDPSAVFIMHETAPLPIVLTPNRTFKATVLA